MNECVKVYACWVSPPILIKPHVYTITTADNFITQPATVLRCAATESLDDTFIFSSTKDVTEACLFFSGDRLRLWLQSVQ